MFDLALVFFPLAVYPAGSLSIVGVLIGGISCKVAAALVIGRPAGARYHQALRRLGNLLLTTGGGVFALAFLAGTVFAAALGGREQDGVIMLVVAFVCLLAVAVLFGLVCWYQGWRTLAGAGLLIGALAGVFWLLETAVSWYYKVYGLDQVARFFDLRASLLGLVSVGLLLAGVGWYHLRAARRPSPPITATF